MTLHLKKNSRQRLVVAAGLAMMGLVGTPRTPCAQEPTIVDVPLATASVPNGVRKYVYYMRESANAPEKEFATWQVETLRDKYNGYPTMLRVMTFVAKDSNIVVDSVLTYERTMAPIWEKSYLEGKRVRLDYDFRGITVQVWLTRDFIARKYRYVYDDPMFNASDVFLVIGSLPLKVGYRGRISSFTYEYENASTDPFQVLRADSIQTPRGMRPAWVTSIVQRGIQMTLWSDQETREVLRLLCLFPDKRQLRLEAAN